MLFINIYYCYYFVLNNIFNVVILAEITMQAIEKKIFDLSPYPIRFWKRYVDDILAVIPKQNCHDFLSFINSINNHIQYESEIEENGKI